MKICRHCKKETNNLFIDATTKRKNGGVYSYYSCRKCNTNRFRKYRKTRQGKKVIKSIVQRYEKKHPEKRKSWNVAQAIIKKNCIKCNRKDSVRHHPDITKPLEVVMLCHLHHIQAHSEMV